MCSYFTPLSSINQKRVFIVLLTELRNVLTPPKAHSFPEIQKTTIKQAPKSCEEPKVASKK